MERVVLDTNVLIDGAHDEHSAAWSIVQQVLDGALRAVISRRLRGEYETLLERTVVDGEYHDRIRRVLAIAEQVRLSDVPAVVADDPEDDKVLATAVSGGADALVTSDRHLLTLDPHGDCRILTPQQFLNIQQEERGGWSDFLRTIGLSSAGSPDKH